MKLLMFAVILPLASCGAASPDEISRLAALLQWRTGSIVADVGAGNGEIARAAAAAVGPSGSVYASELDPGKLRKLHKLELASRNIKVVQASPTTPGLPAACCDSIILRGVYHHLTNPLQIDAALLRALRPGGRLAVIDFAPRRILSTLFPVHAVPGDRGGHGVPQTVVVSELRNSGFIIETQISPWPGNQYCVIARSNH